MITKQYIFSSIAKCLERAVREREKEKERSGSSASEKKETREELRLWYGEHF